MNNWIIARAAIKQSTTYRDFQRGKIPDRNDVRCHGHTVRFPILYVGNEEQEYHINSCTASATACELK